MDLMNTKINLVLHAYNMIFIFESSIYVYSHYIMVIVLIRFIWNSNVCVFEFLKFSRCSTVKISTNINRCIILCFYIKLSFLDHILHTKKTWFFFLEILVSFKISFDFASTMLTYFCLMGILMVFDNYVHLGDD